MCEYVIKDILYLIYCTLFLTFYMLTRCSFLYWWIRRSCWTRSGYSRVVIYFHCDVPALGLTLYKFYWVILIKIHKHSYISVVPVDYTTLYFFCYSIVCQMTRVTFIEFLVMSFSSILMLCMSAALLWHSNIQVFMLKSLTQL